MEHHIMFHFIYKTTCVITNRFYYGMHSTARLDDGYIGSGFLLKRSINKHGRHNHVFEIIEFVENRQLLQDLERSIVNETMITDPLCMNLKLGGEGGGIAGVKRTDVTRKRISEGKKGKPLSEEHKQHLKHSRPNFKHTDETKEKMSQSHMGRTVLPFTDEHKRKLSEARRRRVTSQETKEKLSEYRKKFYESEEGIQRKQLQSQQLKGNKYAKKSKE